MAPLNLSVPMPVFERPKLPETEPFSVSVVEEETLKVALPVRLVFSKSSPKGPVPDPPTTRVCCPMDKSNMLWETAPAALDPMVIVEEPAMVAFRPNLKPVVLLPSSKVPAAMVIPGPEPKALGF